VYKPLFLSQNARQITMSGMQNMFKKAFFKVLIVLFIGFGIASYATYLRTGKFIVPVSADKALEAVKNAPASIKGVVSNVTGGTPASATRTTYKWQDADGSWQFSDTPPMDTMNYEVVQIKVQKTAAASASSSDQPADPLAEHTTAAAGSVASEESATAAQGSEIPQLEGNAYTPDGIKKLLESAKGFKAGVESRQPVPEEL